MKVMSVNASRAGLWEPERNDERTQAFEHTLDAAVREKVALLLLPGGFWSGRTASARAKITDALQEAAERTGIAIVTGVDDVAAKKGRKGDGNVECYGILITRQGELLGPWQQLSTTSDDSVDESIDADSVRERVSKERGGDVVPLICGEMHNERIRQVTASLKPRVVAVCGHVGLGQGLVPALQALNNRSGAAAIHCQHLDPNSTGHHHAIKRSGERLTAELNKQWIGDNDFWYSTAVFTL
jgi:hypothetical protein